jgi:NAD(P)-dependent dehydrogenase (short-subunit alcohol dehydrogenase family)
MTASPALDYSRLGPAPGSRIVIAGGCGGIGRALTDAALQLGLKVIVLDLARSIDAFPPPASVDAFAIDATDDASVAQAFEAIREKHGGIDSLVNLVGFRNQLARFDEIPLEEWDLVIAGNLRSTMLLCRHAAPLLMQSGAGTIVNVASAMATRAVPNHAPYAAAKAAVLTFTRSVAIELAPHIRANAVAPSAVDTDFHRGGTGRQSIEDSANDPNIFAAGVPLGRIARAEDIVGPTLFFAGPHSQFVTGQTLLVNGGTW